jgi:hypothetical protein
MEVNRSIVGFMKYGRCTSCERKTRGKTINRIGTLWYCESCTIKQLQQADGAGIIHPKQPIWESMCTRSPIAQLFDPYVKHRLHLQAIGKETEGGSEATQPQSGLIIRVDAPMDCDDTVCRDADGAYENIVKPGKH